MQENKVIFYIVKSTLSENLVFSEKKHLNLISPSMCFTFLVFEKLPVMVAELITSHSKDNSIQSFSYNIAYPIVYSVFLHYQLKKKNCTKKLYILIFFTELGFS